MPREALIARTFVELADTLVDDFDVDELLTMLASRCVDVFDVSAAGLMLVAHHGDLQVLASSSAVTRVLEIFQLQAREGPSWDCYHTGAPVVSHDVTRASGWWPRFVPQAVAAGFRSTVALPMRLRGTTLGALNLFRVEQGAMNETDLIAVQAFADIATIAILQHRAALDAHVVTEQLNRALSSRVVIEQAKGVLAERAGLDMEQAFQRLRTHARSHNLRLVDVAGAVVAGVLPTAALGAPAPRRRH